MSAKIEIQTLIGEIVKTMAVLDKMAAYHASYSAALPTQDKRTTENAIVLSEIMSNFYTCLETVFLRISQFFENSLCKNRWHNDLLDKMSVNIPSIREPVLSCSSASELHEFLRFRHFRRYYYSFDYDWDRIGMLSAKFKKLYPLVKADMEHFIEFLNRLASEKPT